MKAREIIAALRDVDPEAEVYICRRAEAPADGAVYPARKEGSRA